MTVVVIRLPGAAGNPWTDRLRITGDEPCTTVVVVLPPPEHPAMRNVMRENTANKLKYFFISYSFSLYVSKDNHWALTAEKSTNMY